MSDQSFLPSISNAPSDLQLEKAASSIGISKEGQDWLSYATNLFSDVAIEKARPTDGGPQLSTIIEVPTTFAISKPDSIAADKKWGFHIVQTPFTKPVAFNPATASGNAVNTGPPGVQQEIAGIYVQYFEEGANTVDLIPAPGMAFTHTPDVVVTSSMRLVSQAFEVTSTAAPLVETGSVTAYLSSPSPTLDFKFFGNSESSTGYPCVTMRMPPRNIPEAVRLAGTKTWKAKQGLLSQGWLENIENDSRLPNYFPIVLEPFANSPGAQVWYSRAGRNLSFEPTIS